MQILSKEFESNLSQTIAETFNQLKEAAENSAIKKRWIRQADIQQYVEVSAKTLREWERRGLRRCEPIEGGGVYYDLEEIDTFMKKYKR
ncbi:MerR family transcriptional regulator [Listeria ilorinensis]|uniref:MerR family transcriptional regulator n=1 Tax=Listeria ilorinensis TaxID=2867439 RepID=UPI001EF5BFB4|nr:MerR family transcriptional regulator [Listeria ilorinensis]